MKNNNIKEFPLKKNIVETKKLSKIEILKDNFGSTICTFNAVAFKVVTQFS